jgi:hypothetical protein
VTNITRNLPATVTKNSALHHWNQDLKIKQKTNAFSERDRERKLPGHIHLSQPTIRYGPFLFSQRFFGFMDGQELRFI